MKTSDIIRHPPQNAQSALQEVLTKPNESYKTPNKTGRTSLGCWVPCDRFFSHTLPLGFIGSSDLGSRFEALGLSDVPVEDVKHIPQPMFVPCRGPFGTPKPMGVGMRKKAFHRSILGGPWGRLGKGSFLGLRIRLMSSRLGGIRTPDPMCIHPPKTPTLPETQSSH